MARYAVALWKTTIKAATVVAFAFALSGHSRAAGAATYPSLAPSPAPVNAGNPVTLTLNDAFGVGHPNPDSGIAAIDLRVAFDSSLLFFNSVANRSLLAAGIGWGVPIFNEISPGVELISIAEQCDFVTIICSLDPSGSGDLLALTFDAPGGDASGSTTITVETAGYAEGIRGEYQLAPTYDTISITARAVPAPGLACFLLPGLALVGFRRARGNGVEFRCQP